MFFFLQAVGIMMEKAFGALTGRRVGGVLGFAWAALFILGLGQICSKPSILHGSDRRANEMFD